MTLVGQMYKDQGVKGFYRGVEVNIMRAVVLNATKMGVYDIAKGKVVENTGCTSNLAKGLKGNVCFLMNVIFFIITGSRSSPKTAFCSSFLAGFFMTCTVAPFDRIRTKLMNQPTDQRMYSGLSDCFVKTVRSEGPLSLWRGFIPIWARFAPMATLQLLTIEFLYQTFGFKSI